MANNGYDPNQPRDERGRWTDSKGFFKANTSYEEISKDDKGREIRKVPINFFGEELALEKQTPHEIRKGIRTLRKRITEHEERIKNPNKLSYWNRLTPERKKGLLIRWGKEIDNFHRGIAKRIEELNNRGEKYD